MTTNQDHKIRLHTADELNAMTPAEYKTLEARLRRAAKRQGLRLVKSRVRTPELPNYGTYRLVDEQNNLVAGDSTSGLGLDDVERALNEGLGDVEPAP